MNGFAGQHAVVTGGAGGIGAAISGALVDAGARVTLVGRDVDRLVARAEELDASYEQADVTEDDEVVAALAGASEKNGAITILVNNAGAAESAAFEKTDDALWHRMLAVNLTGVFNCTRAVLPEMAKEGAGRVVNIASTAALTGYPYVAAYCAAKHGVLGMTRALALEYARTGVTVNAVCPGFTNTALIEESLDKIMSVTGRSREEALAELVKVNPQGRLIEPEEVAETVLWVCRQASINGQAIAVAGGEVM